MYKLTHFPAGVSWGQIVTIGLKKNNNRIYRTNETCFMNVPKKLQMQQSVCVLCGDSSIRFAGDSEVIIC